MTNRGEKPDIPFKLFALREHVDPKARKGLKAKVWAKQMPEEFEVAIGKRKIKQAAARVTLEVTTMNVGNAGDYLCTVPEAGNPWIIRRERFEGLYELADNQG